MSWYVALDGPDGCGKSTQAARLVRAGGPIVISEPPGVDRWDDQLLAELGLRRVEAPAVAPVAAGSKDLDGLVAVFLPR